MQTKTSRATNLCTVEITRGANRGLLLLHMRRKLQRAYLVKGQIMYYLNKV